MTCVSPHRLAKRFIGLREVPGVMANPQVLAMLQLVDPAVSRDDVPWCSAFANYICWLLELPRSGSLKARSWESVGCRTLAPEAGWVISVFWRVSPESGLGHVGFYDHVDDGLVHVIGGNQHDAVSLDGYPLNQLLCHRQLA